MSNLKIKAAIIGCGMIANFHYNALCSLGVAVSGVYDEYLPAAKAFGEKNNVSVFSSLKKLFDSDVDLVAVCTPSGTHAQIAVDALASGKHIAVEKPLALNYEDCLRVIEVADNAKKICAPISQLRFSPSVARVKATLESGGIGRLVMASVYMKYFREKAYYTSSPWKGTEKMDGGGALMNQGIHGIDLLCFLAGEVKTVFGRTATLLHDIETEDTAVASLEFVSGALGTIEGATSTRPGYPRKLELCGVDGSIIMQEDTVVGYHPESLNLRCDTQTAAGGFTDPAAISSDGHTTQYKNILAAIRGKEQLYYTPQDAAKTVRLINAIYRSAKTSKPVELK